MWEKATKAHIIAEVWLVLVLGVKIAVTPVSTSHNN
jgi:hypothetical protein